MDQEFCCKRILCHKSPSTHVVLHILERGEIEWGAASKVVAATKALQLAVVLRKLGKPTSSESKKLPKWLSRIIESNTLTPFLKRCSTSHQDFPEPLIVLPLYLFSLPACRV